MNLSQESVRVVDWNKSKPEDFFHSFSDCLILTKDHKIMMQQRTPDWGKSAGFLTAFGGHVESGETALEAVIRELKEETGAVAKPRDVLSIASITEAETNHTDIVHLHFWHDKKGTITGCYECEAVYYDRAAGALAHPKIMDYAAWLLNECKRRNLIP